MLDAIQELLQIVRSLARRPGAPLLAVVTLGLALGGATALFSFVDGVLLRPLDYPDPDRIVMLCSEHREQADEWCGASPPDLRDWTEQSGSFAATTLARRWHFTLRGEDDRLTGVSGGIATPGLLAVFGASPALGRTLRPEDLEPGAPRVVLLSHALWERRFGAAPDVIGRTLLLDDEPRAVAGVLPPELSVPFLEGVELWIPLWPERVDARWWRGFMAFGRLQPGVERAAAQSAVGTVAARLAHDYPETNLGWGVRVESLLERTVRPVRTALLVLLGAVLMVVIIACANVANLLLVRGTLRRRELAVRAALGAGPWRLARQQLAEGIVLAGAGAVLGALVATWTVDAFVSLAPSSFPRLGNVGVDARSLGFGALAALATCALFSLAPLLRGRRHDLREVVQSGPSGSEPAGTARLRSTLVVAELALAVMLLAGAGLLGRSVSRLLDWRPGFDRDGLLAVQVFPPIAKYPEAASLVPLYERFLADLRALPGVVSAGAGSAGPLFGGDGAQELFRADRPEPPDGNKPRAFWFDVGPRYFSTLGVPILRGRSFTERDAAGAPRVAIVNETLARELFGDDDPIGRSVQLSFHEMTVEVVGVARDVSPFLPGERPRPEIYWPWMQSPRWAVHLILRSGADPGPLAPLVRMRLAAIDPDLEMGRFFTLHDRVEGRLVTPRFNAALLGGFAALATLIAGVGVYGVVAFAVGLRTREIGIRMALGARRGRVLAELLSGGARLAGVGVALGLGGAVALTRLLRSLLVGVEPTDPLALGGAAALLGALTLLATFVPASRASRIDPATVLRHE